MLDCPVTTLVVCPDAQSAAFYASPVHTDLPGYTFRAAVLGPATIPVVTDPLQVADRPELAAMSVMAHGRRREVAQAFADGMKHLNPEHAPKYTEYAYAMAAPAVRRILEEIMSSSTWPVYSPFAREHFGRGEAKGEAEAILLVLSARGLEVSDKARTRITSCGDLDQLKAWVRRAATAQTTEDLFR